MKQEKFQKTNQFTKHTKNNKRMKKTNVLLLALTLLGSVFFLTGCQEDESLDVSKENTHNEQALINEPIIGVMEDAIVTNNQDKSVEYTFNGMLVLEFLKSRMKTDNSISQYPIISFDSVDEFKDFESTVRKISRKQIAELIHSLEASNGWHSKYSSLKSSESESDNNLLLGKDEATYLNQDGIVEVNNTYYLLNQDGYFIYENGAWKNVNGDENTSLYRSSSSDCLKYSYSSNNEDSYCGTYNESSRKIEGVATVQRGWFSTKIKSKTYLYSRNTCGYSNYSAYWVRKYAQAIGVQMSYRAQDGSKTIINNRDIRIDLDDYKFVDTFDVGSRNACITKIDALHVAKHGSYISARVYMTL